MFYNFDTGVGECWGGGGIYFYTQNLRVTVSCIRVCAWRGQEFVFLSASDGSCHGLQLLTGQRAWTSWVHESVQASIALVHLAEVTWRRVSSPGPDHLFFSVLGSLPGLTLPQVSACLS